MIRVSEPLWVSEHNITEFGGHLHDLFTQSSLGLPRLVLLPRSGYTIGEIISRQWDVSGGEMLHASVGERKPLQATSPGKPADFYCGQFPTQAEVEGANLLVIDAVARTGETLEFAARRLRKMGATVHTAALYEKAQDEESRVEFPPNFSFERRDPKIFTIFAWETDEYLPIPDDHKQLGF